MTITQTLEFKLPIDVTFHVDSVTDDWIEGYLTVILGDEKGEYYFKTNNKAPLKFNVPVVDVDFDGNIYLENPKRACLDGNFEKSIPIIGKLKIPLQTCQNV